MMVAKKFSSYILYEKNINKSQTQKSQKQTLYNTAYIFIYEYRLK